MTLGLPGSFFCKPIHNPSFSFSALAIAVNSDFILAATNILKSRV